MQMRRASKQAKSREREMEGGVLRLYQYFNPSIKTNKRICDELSKPLDDLKHYSIRKSLQRCKGCRQGLGGRKTD